MAASASASLRHHLLLRRRPRFPLGPSPTFRTSSLPRRHQRLFASAPSSSTVENGEPSSPVEPSDGASVVDVNPPRGTRDFPPEDMRLRTWLFDQFREVSERRSCASHLSRGAIKGCLLGLVANASFPFATEGVPRHGV